MFDDLRPMFEQHIGRLAHESLCLLYVAVTRAREGLFMLIDPPGESSRTAPARMASLVLHALRPADQGPVEPDQVVYEHGDPQWLAPHAPVAPAAVDPSAPHLESPQAPLTFAPTQGPLLRTAKSGRLIIVIDGCPLHCALRTLQRHGVRADRHYDLAERGVAKRPHEDFSPEEAKEMLGQLLSDLPASSLNAGVGSLESKAKEGGGT